MANEYSAGNLELQIKAFSNEANTSLSNVSRNLQYILSYASATLQVFRSLRTAIKGIADIKFTGLQNALKEISSLDVQSAYSKMNALSRVVAPLQNINLSGLNAFGNSLRAVTKINVDDFSKKIDGLSTSLTPFFVQIDKYTPALNAFGSAMSGLGMIKGAKTINLKQATGGFGGGGGGGAISLFHLLNKLYALRNYTKQFFNSIKEGFQYAVNYTETLNLWQVAMKGNREEAEKFVSTMNKAYGVSEQTLMNYQAIFRNMLSSLGAVDDNTSYALSEYLTQMALDYASLYNTTIEKAMTTFQSVLSGSIRPIRSIAGYDITDTTIYQLYQSMGGTKTQRALTQTEKRLLRIYAVFQQMQSSGAIGDLAKTLNTTANQLRVMSEASKELIQWIGILIESVFKPVLPYINAFLITAKEVVKTMVQLAGVDLGEFGVMSDNLETANEELDKMQGKLLSFDRFEALNSSSNGDNILGFDETILEAMKKYESVLSGVTSETQKLVEEWSKWLFEYDSEGKIKGLTVQAKALFTILTLIGAELTLIISYNLIAKIGKLTKLLLGLPNTNFIAWLQNIQLQGALANTMLDKMSVAFDYLKVSIMAAVGAFVIMDSIISSLDGDAKKIVSFGSIVVGVLGTILGIILAIRGGLKGGLLGATIAGLGVGALLAGIKGVANANANLQRRKTGGVVEDGLFTMSKGEIIGEFDDGSTVVANNQQIIEGIRQGVYSAVTSAMGAKRGGGDVILDGYKVGKVITRGVSKEQQRVGYAK